MNDSDKAKKLLNYNGEIIDVDVLPRGSVMSVDYTHRGELTMFDSFNHNFLMGEEEKMENSIVEVDVHVKFVGKVKDLKYLLKARDENCSIIPRK